MAAINETLQLTKLNLKIGWIMKMSPLNKLHWLRKYSQICRWCKYLMSFPTILTSTEPEPKQHVFHGHNQNKSSNSKSAGSEV